jgi:hypothetical protein
MFIDIACGHIQFMATYFLVIRFIAKCGAKVEDLGKPDFVSKISITVTAAGKLVSVMYH